MMVNKVKKAPYGPEVNKVNRLYVSGYLLAYAQSPSCTAAPLQ